MNTVASLTASLAAVESQLTQLLAKQAAVIAAGDGPTYSISGPSGSESVDMCGFLRWLGDEIDKAIQRQRTILELLAEEEPINARRRLRVGGSLIG